MQFDSNCQHMEQHLPNKMMRSTSPHKATALKLPIFHIVQNTIQIQAAVESYLSSNLKPYTDQILLLITKMMPQGTHFQMIQFPDQLHSIPAVTNQDTMIAFFSILVYKTVCVMQGSKFYIGLFFVWLGTRKDFRKILNMYLEHNGNVKEAKNI